jgi:hypothetical protein
MRKRDLAAALAATVRELEAERTMHRNLREWHTRLEEAYAAACRRIDDLEVDLEFERIARGGK